MPLSATNVKTCYIYAKLFGILSIGVSNQCVNLTAHMMNSPGLFAQLSFNIVAHHSDDRSIDS